MFPSRRYRRKSKFRIILLITLIGLLVGGVLLSQRLDFGQGTTIGQHTILAPLIEKFPNQSVREYMVSLFSDMQISSAVKPQEDAALVAKVALVSDSHSDVDTFSKVLSQVVRDQPDILIHLGDVSTAGEQADLEAMKRLMDDTGLVYYVLPGDHDYNWVPRHDLSNFLDVFYQGVPEQMNRTVEIQGYQLILYENSLGAQGVSTQSLGWLRSLLSQNTSATYKGRFIFTSTPPINPYFADKADAGGRELLDLLADADISQVFSGDVHIYARFTDDATDITVTTVGASGSYKNPLPQYVMLELYENGAFDIKARPVVDLESIE